MSCLSLPLQQPTASHDNTAHQVLMGSSGNLSYQDVKRNKSLSADFPSCFRLYIQSCRGHRACIRTWNGSEFNPALRSFQHEKLTDTFRLDSGWHCYLRRFPTTQKSCCEKFFALDRQDIAGSPCCTRLSVVRLDLFRVEQAQRRTCVGEQKRKVVSSIDQ